MRVAHTLTIGLAAAVTLGVTAVADEQDHVLLPGDKLVTRLVLGERRAVAVAGVPGQKLSILVKRGRSSSVEPSLVIAGPDGVELQPGKRLKISKKTARLRGLPIDREGRWRATFSALSGGGDVEVKVSGKAPGKAKFKGQTANADDPVEHTFFALPGSELQLKVSAKGKPRWTPEAEIVAPSGLVLDAPVAAKGGIPIFLDELGEHVLRLRGGPGAYVAKLKIVSPRIKGRPLQFSDVEAPPVLTGFSPTTVRNDDDGVEIEVTGMGFSSQHSVTVSASGQGYASSKISVLPTGGRATIDTTGVPPGTYRVGVSTSVGNAVYAAEPLVITNRVPGILLASAPEFPAFSEIDVKLTGRGFDADCEVELQRSGDGAEIPVTVATREGHTVMNVVMRPPAYQVGVYDAIVRDPSGEEQTYPSYFDVVGYRSAPGDVLEHRGDRSMGEVYAYDAAYDARRNRVLISTVVENQLEFLLVDTGTLQVLQTYTVGTSQGFVHFRPRVEWHPLDDTFALSWSRDDFGAHRGFVRVCSADDLSDELSLTQVAFDDEVTQVDVAANDDDGGWLAVWEVYDPTAGSRIQTQPIDADGSTSASNRITVTTNAAGLQWTPSIVYRGDDRYVMAYIGANASETDYALRRMVLRTDGSIAQGSLQLAASNDWFGMIQPEMAVNPNDGSILLAFTYYLSDRARPAFALLVGASSHADTVEARSSDGLLAAGFVDSVVWSPERGEFVLGLTDYLTDWRAMVRRITPEGRLKPLYVPLDYEGYFTVLWSGPNAGQLGYIRACDGDDSDDRSDTRGDDVTIRAGRIR